MLNYFFRKLAYSVLVVLGVTILTFLLFRLAAGDPAAALLGKNPSPEEVESLRRELGSDLPLFYGHWRTSEIFGTAAALPATLQPQEELRIVRRFAAPEKVRITVSGSGTVALNGGADRELSAGQPVTLEVDAETAQIMMRAGNGGAQITAIAAARFQQSGWESQFSRSLGELCRFDSEFPYVSMLNFGNTLVTREPIRKILLRGVGPSLALMIPVFLGELLLGIVLALIAAAAKDTWLDRLLLVTSVLMMSISYLVLIIAGQWFLGYRWGWFPVWGFEGPHCLILPILIGIASGLGGSVRFYRTVFVNELNREYLRTAKGKGCSPWCIFRKHLLGNALVPIITHATGVLPFLFTGSLLLESFFGIPGLGYAGIDALNNSDLQLVKAITIVNALMFVGANLLSDIACACADPRIRLT